MASEISELREKQSQDPEHFPLTGEFFSRFNVDSNEQHAGRVTVRRFGAKEADEDVYQNVVNVAMKVEHQISKTDISICHRVPRMWSRRLIVFGARRRKARLGMPKDGGVDRTVKGAKGFSI